MDTKGRLIVHGLGTEPSVLYALPPSRHTTVRTYVPLIRLIYPRQIRLSLS